MVFVIKWRVLRSEHGQSLLHRVEPARTVLLETPVPGFDERRAWLNNCVVSDGHACGASWIRVTNANSTVLEAFTLEKAASIVFKSCSIRERDMFVPIIVVMFSVSLLVGSLNGSQTFSSGVWFVDDVISSHGISSSPKKKLNPSSSVPSSIISAVEMGSDVCSKRCC